ncbi:MAG TPA: permease prefix domain 2-containing transporter, partial [Chryseosolibacter sp.]|nr:permease prefix domain 2-containing transporter [Chryseosolibacter sp.]
MNPPKTPLSFLRWFCREDYLEEIEGDLMEVFNKQIGKSPRKAKWNYAWSVIKYFRPEFMKSFKNLYQPDPYCMYQSYFKIGWRTLLKNKGYSMINIGGLAAGMAVAMFIGLWVHDELSFNKYHKNYQDIAQVWGGGTDPETQKIGGFFAMQYPVGTVLKNNYPQYFSHVLMAWHTGDHTLSSADQKFNKAGLFIEGGALEMLSLKMLKGTYASLSSPHSIVLSASTAAAIFGSEDPIN